MNIVQLESIQREFSLRIQIFSENHDSVGHDIVFRKILCDFLCNLLICTAIKYKIV